MNFTESLQKTLQPPVTAQQQITDGSEALRPNRQGHDEERTLRSYMCFSVSSQHLDDEGGDDPAERETFSLEERGEVSVCWSLDAAASLWEKLTSSDRLQL